MSKEKNNKYNSDKPINSIEEDLLGRASFSKQLGESLLDYSGEDTFVVGLFGGWGTGKTSVINMVLEEIENNTDGDEKQPIIVRFSPWNYSSHDDLVLQFLNCIKDEIDVKVDGELKEKIGNALSTYSGALNVLSLIPFAGPAVSGAATNVIKNLGDNLSQKKSLEQSKISLEGALKELGRKIIVVIDDIDRLSDAQIQNIFRLVKQVADLPNVIYLLSMERDVVVKALDVVQQYDGSDYLEKIIQIPFVIPEIDKQKIQYVLFERINEIVETKDSSIVIDQEYWSKIFMYCVRPYFGTLRDVNRFINVFRFRFNSLCNEVCLEDIIAITIFEVLNTDLYKWISKNKDAVCGGELHSFSIQGKNKNEIKEDYIKQFIDNGIKDADEALKAVSTIFPVFAKDIGEASYSSSREDRKKMRVSQPERFDLMFSFDLESLPVSRGVITGFMNNYSEKTSEQLLDELNGSESIQFFLSELLSMASEVPYERIPQIISVLNKKENELKGEESFINVFRSAKRFIEEITDVLMKRLKNDDERFSIIMEQLDSGDVTRINGISRIINKVENAYGRFKKDSENDEDKIITEEQLNIVEKEFLNAINNIDDLSLLLDKENCAQFLFLWRKLNEEQAKEKMEDVLSNDDNCLKYLCRMSSTLYGLGSGKGWSYHERKDDFITVERIKEIVDKYDKKEMIQKFSEEELMIIAAFILGYDEKGNHEVHEKEARELVDEWKK